MIDLIQSEMNGLIEAAIKRTKDEIGSNIQEIVASKMGERLQTFELEMGNR